MLSIIELERLIADERNKLSQAKNQVKTSSEMIRRLESTLSERAAISNDSAASKVLRISGEYTGNGDQVSVIKDAIESLVSGCDRLKRTQLSTKNYDRWRDQRSDHRYGYCPRHGSISFSIGLEIRDRDLTDEEITEAVTYLRALLTPTQINH